MSSRQLRRLGSDDLESTLARFIKDAPPVTKTSKTASPKNSNSNVFALFDDEQEIEEAVEEDVKDIPEDFKSAVKLPTKSQKKKDKKRQKKVKASKGAASGINSDEEFDILLKQFQLNDGLSAKKKDYCIEETSQSSGGEYDTALESESVASGTSINKVMWDPGFTKFNHFNELYEAFSNIDFKNLSPDNEFRLLFGDISSESLDDVDSMTSVNISPQVLKQIQRMKRLVRNWGGRDRKSVPNAGTVRQLQFTKIRDDWLPTQRGELLMKSLDEDTLMDWELWKCPNDWKDVIQGNVRKWKNHISFYKFEPLNKEINKKYLTEFYLNVVVHPDHEALINMISSKYPYHIPGLLQVAMILIRQGDKSSSNGLVERALFVFDRSLRNGIAFDSRRFQLPYIYFYNRQFYLAIFRYLQIISQRGALTAASSWVKVLWSLSPLEDPLGVRYFIDHYLLMNKEYTYIIKMGDSPLFKVYEEWFTLGIALGIVLSYLKLGNLEAALAALQHAFKCYPECLSTIFTDVLLGNRNCTAKLQSLMTPTMHLQVAAYMVRMKAVWLDNDLSWLYNELNELLGQYESGTFDIRSSSSSQSNPHNHFFIDGFPVNLLRFVILSQESSAMAKIPAHIWSDYDVYEYDVLPPKPNINDPEDTTETIKTFIDERELQVSQFSREQDEELLNQIRQLSIEQYLEDNS